MNLSFESFHMIRIVLLAKDTG